VQSFFPEDFDFRPGCRVYPDTHRLNFTRGDWTDDTDQLLLVLQSLLATGGTPNALDFARRLQSWVKHGFPDLGDQNGSGLGKMTKQVVLNAEFLTKPSEVAESVWRRSGQNLAPNGAVMRAAVCGLPRFWDLDSVEATAAVLCRVTHFDDRCVASTVCVAVAAACALQGMAGAQAAEEGVRRGFRYVAAENLEDYQRYTRADISLEDLQLDEQATIGYTLKCLACGLWGLRHEGKFEHIISELVWCGGDADTNAVVCGALVGCRIGYSNLPQAWIPEMPYASWLAQWSLKPMFVLGVNTR
jgi:ADP-ribosylglycohydrolase